MDPPYDKKLVNKTIKKILERNILNSNGKIVVEHSIREKIDPALAQYIQFNRSTRNNQVSILSEEKNENI
jgi:16S rRNA G966 N2-methylase RsmD